MKENLAQTKDDWEHNKKWIRSSTLLTKIQDIQTTTRNGIGFKHKEQKSSQSNPAGLK